MMDKYQLFLKLLDVVDCDFNVIDADMNNWEGAIEIVGECDGRKITLTAKLKEENKDA